MCYFFKYSEVSFAKMTNEMANKLAKTDIPTDSYLLKINKGMETPKQCLKHGQSLKKDTRMTSVKLVCVTLKIFYTLFWCFWC